MKVLIVSDTHGRHTGLDRVLEKEGKIDLFIHLGDIEGGESYINSVVECEKHMVRGNNDFFSDLPREEEIDIGGYKAFITHGHPYLCVFGFRVYKRGRRSSKSRYRDVWSYT